MPPSVPDPAQRFRLLSGGVGADRLRCLRLSCTDVPSCIQAVTRHYLRQHRPVRVSLAAAGRDLLIAPQPQEYAPGEAFLFDGRTGALRRMLSSPTPSPADWFGTSVAATDRLLVVAASGAVHVFDNAGNFLRIVCSLEPQRGTVASYTCWRGRQAN